MRIRLFWAAVALAASAAAFADCTPVPSEPLPGIEARLARTQAMLAAVPESGRDKVAYRQLQEDALLDLEKVQCLREVSAPAEAVKRGAGIATTFATIPVLFVTDRAVAGASTEAAGYFSAARADTGVTYARVSVNMPAENYEPGSVPPIGVTLSTERDSSKGISLTLPQILDASVFDTAIADYKRAQASNEPVRVLLFVHGFNVSYRDSVQAAARLAWGLRLNVLPIAISWPSQAKILRYWEDEQSIEPSTERLRPIVQKILSHPAVDEVILVAHSMGSRLATRVLSQLDLEKATMPKLARVAFAAADLNEEEINELWPRIKRLPRQGWTFYTSGNDFALLASRIVHSRPPVGDSRDRVFTASPSDTVDASAIAPTLKGYGHSYLIDNPRLQLDLRQWIARGTPADKRQLKAGERPPAVFWTLSK